MNLIVSLTNVYKVFLHKNNISTRKPFTKDERNFIENNWFTYRDTLYPKDKWIRNFNRNYNLIKKI